MYIMADIVDRPTRSRMMASIRGSNTKPELFLRKALHARGFRFRINVRKMPGTPDIVLRRWNCIIQVHGCFWHRHPGCPKSTMPSSNVDFWNAKFTANVRRDALALQQLQEMGWRTAVVWECAIGRKENEALIDALELFIRGTKEKQFKIFSTRASV
ncbi:very short patch repair endonuclease [Roseovarius gaetbuli]|uniref:very short patch repair endonuclease n=1 Tax=Roseovarius gaetbuli TaxID=1356575 RepID=UPI002795CFD4|nr:very short patch repair endonuclease [Roseovarius gaetbuli]